MPDTVWQQIRNAIDARLKLILVANGYQTDAGKNVFYWRTTDFKQNEDGTLPDLPAIKYFETTEENETLNMAIESNTIALNIEVLAGGSDDEAVKTALDQMYADILKCVGVDETWGGLALLTEIKAHEVKLEREELLMGSILTVFELKYRHRRWDPFTAA